MNGSWAGIILLVVFTIAGLVLGFSASRTRAQFQGTLAAFVAMATTVVLFCAFIILQSQEWLLQLFIIMFAALPLLAYGVVRGVGALRERSKVRPTVAQLGHVPEGVRRAANNVIPLRPEEDFEPLPDYAEEPAVAAAVAAAGAGAGAAAQRPSVAAATPAPAPAAAVERPHVVVQQPAAVAPEGEELVAAAAALAPEQAPDLLPVPATLRPSATQQRPVVPQPIPVGAPTQQPVAPAAVAQPAAAQQPAAPVAPQPAAAAVAPQPAAAVVQQPAAATQQRPAAPAGRPFKPVVIKTAQTAPTPTTFDPQSYFTRATTLRDKGLFLVAAQLYAECASLTGDAATFRKASVEQVACYVKGGKLAAAQDLAAQLVQTRQDLSPVEVVKLNAVLRSVA